MFIDRLSNSAPPLAALQAEARHQSQAVGFRYDADDRCPIFLIENSISDRLLEAAMRLCQQGCLGAHVLDTGSFSLLWPHVLEAAPGEKVLGSNLLSLQLAEATPGPLLEREAALVLPEGQSAHTRLFLNDRVEAIAASIGLLGRADRACTHPTIRIPHLQVRLNRMHLLLCISQTGSLPAQIPEILSG